MSSEAVKSKNITIFISYAQADEHLFKKLVADLSMLQRQNPTLVWFERNIDAGTSWEHEINGVLDTAAIILVLISPDFVASDYCYSSEMEYALRRHRSGKARVIPIILRPTLWQGTPFGHLQALPSDAKPLTVWRNQEQAFIDIAQGIRRVVKEMLLRATGMDAESPSPVWHVPAARNPYFTRREEVLEHIHEKLTKTQVVALMGPSGMGKTEAAREYAYRYRDRYHSVLWVNASTPETLNGDFMVIANLLHLPEKEQQNQQIIVNAVKHRLEEYKRWLLIFDNADDRVYDFLPTGDAGHILLTTRKVMGIKTNRIQISPMSLNEGSIFLQKRTQIASMTKNAVETRAFIEELEGLPLALDLAAAYIAATGCSLEEYLAAYRAHPQEHLNPLIQLSLDYPKVVAIAWSLTFQKIEEVNKGAAGLLRSCVFLAPDDIPEEILGEEPPSDGVVPNTDWLQFTTEAQKCLLNYGLVRRNAEMKTLSVHPLVQTVLLYTMTPMQKYQYAQKVVETINALFSVTKDKSEAFYQRYLPHAYRCKDLIAFYVLIFPQSANLLYEIGKYFYAHSMYEEASTFYREALRICEALQEAGQQENIKVAGALAQLYLVTERYAEAEVLLNDILALAVKDAAVSQLELATLYSSLAQLYLKQSRHEEAETFYQQAVAIQEQELGADHPDGAQNLSNLAALYQYQGKYAEAETFYLRVLAIREKQLGAEHPDTAQSLNNLGILYQNEGKYQEAEALYRRALAIREKQLGKEHPDVAESLNNLAVLYDIQGNLEIAERLYKRALAIYERVLGPDHPNTAHNLRNLAGLYQNQGRFEQAELLYERAKAILGTDNSQPQS